MALDNSAITTKLFRSVLLRDPVKAELDYWKNELDLSLNTPAGMVLVGASTDEFNKVALNIALMYESAFGRYATNTELMAWRQFYQTGASLADIGNLFVRSTEFANSNLGLTSTTAYVNAIAKVALGRTATSTELSDYVSAIDAGRKNYGDVLFAYASQSPDRLKVGLAMLYAGLTDTLPTNAVLPATTDAKVGVSSLLASHLTASTLSYSKTQVVEATSNDGSVNDSVTLNLQGGAKFAGSLGAKLGTLTKVPDGVVAAITKVNDTQALLTFTGKATKHDAASSVLDVAIAFKDSDFVGAKAADIEGSNKTDFAVLFRDNVPFAEVSGLLSLAGTVLGDVVLNLTTSSLTVAAQKQNLASGAFSNVSIVDAAAMVGGKVHFTGSANADIYFASAQGDTIRGMAGNDVLQAGAGSDTFIFENSSATNGVDVIDGFTIGATGDVLNVSALLNSTQTANLATRLSTATTAAAWGNGDVLVVSGNGLTSAASVASLFGAGSVFAAPTVGNKAVVITADVIGNATVWHLVNQVNVTSITADELTEVATLVGVNNFALVPFVAANFA
jgi:hypothetical protein